MTQTSTNSLADSSTRPTPPSWNLDRLFTGPDDPRLFSTLETASQMSRAFAERWSGRLAGASPDEIADAIAAIETIQTEATLPATWSDLRFAADTAPENGSLAQKLREATVNATLPLIFFPIELGAVCGKRLPELVAHPRLAGYAHYLTTLAGQAPHRLSEVEESLLQKRALTGRRAFARLHTELVSEIRVSVDGSSVTLSQALSELYGTDSHRRRMSADAISDALAPHARTLAFVYNNLVQDKAIEDNLRGYDSPESVRHAENHLPESVAETVARVVEESHPIVSRYYRAKRARLGLAELTHADRYAPIETHTENVAFDDARRLILGAFESFSLAYARAADGFFTDDWIDAAPRPGKQGGAFCASPRPTSHAVILMSYLGSPGDVRTLAHELGHGIHAELSRIQSPFHFHPTLAIAEVASTFAEQLVFDAQDRAAPDNRARRSLYASQIESSFSTIHRQIALFRFEQSAHRLRKDGELSVASLCALWQEKNGAMFGDSVRLPESHGLWWSYIPHFIGVPFYVYAYSFGLLLALGLYARYQSEGESFAPKFLTMLAAGGSLPPKELVAPLGIDLEDIEFWRGGIGILDGWVSNFEALARD